MVSNRYKPMFIGARGSEPDKFTSRKRSRPRGIAKHFILVFKRLIWDLQSLECVGCILLPWQHLQSSLYCFWSVHCFPFPALVCPIGSSVNNREPFCYTAASEVVMEDTESDAESILGPTALGGPANPPLIVFVVPAAAWGALCWGQRCFTKCPVPAQSPGYLLQELTTESCVFARHSFPWAALKTGQHQHSLSGAVVGRKPTAPCRQTVTFSVLLCCVSQGQKAVQSSSEVEADCWFLQVSLHDTLWILEKYRCFLGNILLLLLQKEYL